MLLMEVFLFCVVVFALYNCHICLIPLTILYVTLHFLSQEEIPATVSFLTCETCTSKYEKRKRKKSI